MDIIGAVPAILRAWVANVIHRTNGLALFVFGLIFLCFLMHTSLKFVKLGHKIIGRKASAAIESDTQKTNSRTRFYMKNSGENEERNTCTR